jgi:hypothetical protein
MQVGANEPLAPSSVAEAINNSAKYDERTLTLTGALLPNVHGPFLQGNGCEVRFGAMKKPLACAVLVALPNCHGPESRCGQELTKVVDTVLRKQAERQVSAILVSLTGKFVVAPTVFVENAPPTVVPGLPKGEKEGFGHMHGFPAKLLVIDGRVLSSEESTDPKVAGH